MPIVNMTLIKGREQEDLEKMYVEVTDAIHRTLGAPKENIRICVNEVEPQHFAIAGKPKTGPSS